MTADADRADDLDLMRPGDDLATSSLPSVSPLGPDRGDDREITTDSPESDAAVDLRDASRPSLLPWDSTTNPDLEASGDLESSASDSGAWRRQPGENDRQWAAFQQYCFRTPAVMRSLPRLSEETGLAVGTLRNWSSRHRWSVRCSAWDARVEVERTALAEARMRASEELRGRLLHAQMVAVALEAEREAEDMRSDPSARMDTSRYATVLNSVLKELALRRGEPTSRVAQTISDEQVGEDLDKELRRLGVAATREDPAEESDPVAPREVPAEPTSQPQGPTPLKISEQGPDQIAARDRSGVRYNQPGGPSFA